jgi:hypothetical protein
VLWATLAALLGIPLWLILAAGFFTWWRFRMIRRDPRSVRAALRVDEGEVPNVKEKWKRGYIAWESDVLIWVKVPSLLELTAVQVSSVTGLGRADPEKVKRMGDDPRRAEVSLASGAMLELASSEEDVDRVLGPFG